MVIRDLSRWWLNVKEAAGSSLLGIWGCTYLHHDITYVDRYLGYT